jgi:hypothetical protein
MNRSPTVMRGQSALKTRVNALLYPRIHHLAEKERIAGSRGSPSRLRDGVPGPAMTTDST